MTSIPTYREGITFRKAALNIPTTDYAPSTVISGAFPRLLSVQPHVLWKESIHHVATFPEACSGSPIYG